ncbi:MAG: hypothetical protein ACRC1U_03195 [Vibrionaceae bacterium]
MSIPPSDHAPNSVEQQPNAGDNENTALLADAAIRASSENLQSLQPEQAERAEAGNATTVITAALGAATSSASQLDLAEQEPQGVEEEAEGAIALPSPPALLEAPFSQQLLNASHPAQLDRLLFDVFNTQSRAESQRMMQALIQRHEELERDRTGCCRRAMDSAFAQFERIMPSHLILGEQVNFRLLTHMMRGATTSLTSEQATTIGDALTAVLFQFPTFTYQFPRFIREIRQALAERVISPSLISRLILCCSSLLLMLSATLSLSGGVAAGAGAGLYIAGIATSALGAPILLASFAQAWIGFQRQRRWSPIDNSLQRFVSQENVMQISERVLLRGLNLLSAIAGQALIYTAAQEHSLASNAAVVNATVTPTLAVNTTAGANEVNSYSAALTAGFGALFAINCLNLCLQRRPFEIASNPRNCLRHNGYRFDPATANLQYLSLHVDLNFGPQLVTALQNWRGLLRFAFNGRRLTLEQQYNFFERFIESLSSENTGYLNAEQRMYSLQILRNIFGYQEDSTPFDMDFMEEALPAAMVGFFVYLQQQVGVDRCCLMGNSVYEKIIAILLKALAFREAILSMHSPN